MYCSVMPLKIAPLGIGVEEAGRDADLQHGAALAGPPEAALSAPSGTADAVSVGVVHRQIAAVKIRSKSARVHGRGLV